jgi:hypothetical protein
MSGRYFDGFLKLLFQPGDGALSISPNFEFGDGHYLVSGFEAAI